MSLPVSFGVGVIDEGNLVQVIRSACFLFVQIKHFSVLLSCKNHQFVVKPVFCLPPDGHLPDSEGLSLPSPFSPLKKLVFTPAFALGVLTHVLPRGSFYRYSDCNNTLLMLE